MEIVLAWSAEVQGAGRGRGLAQKLLWTYADERIALEDDSPCDIEDKVADLWRLACQRSVGQDLDISVIDQCADIEVVDGNVSSDVKKGAASAAITSDNG